MKRFLRATVALLIVIAVSVGVFSGCNADKKTDEATPISSAESAPEVSSQESFGSEESGSEETSKYGNLNSNLLAGGYAVTDGDYVYYATDTGIYVKSKRSNKSQRLTTDKAFELNLCGDWIIYRVRGTDSYRRMEKTGEKNNEALNNASNLRVYDGSIYYTDYKDDGYYKTDVYFSNKTKILDNVTSNVNVYEGKIYWGDNIDVNIAELDGSGIVTYKDAGSQYMVIDGTEKYTNGTMSRSDINGKNSKTIGSLPVFDFVVDGEWIYFTEMNVNLSKRPLYKMKTDGSELTLLDSSKVLGFSLVGDWLYCLSDGKSFKIKTDGTDKAILE